jgi:serine phosphatase RsbU (regulator of sigma subunit)
VREEPTLSGSGGSPGVEVSPEPAERRRLGAGRGPLLGWRRTILGVVLGMVSLAAVTSLVFLHPRPAPLVPGLLYMLVVVGATVIGGLWPGIVTAGLGFIALDYYFIPPRYSFAPDRLVTNGGKVSGLVALAVFIAVSLAIVPLINRSQASRVRALMAQERLSFLLEASEVLASSLEYRTTLPQVVRMSVPAVADWAAVYMVSEDGSIGKLAVAASEPGAVRELQQPRPPDPVSDLGVPNVIRTGLSELHPRVTRALLQTFTNEPDGFRFLRRDRMRSYLSVPIKTRGRAVGAIAMATGASRRRLSETDLTLVEDLSRRASTTMEHAVLYEERDHIARTLQRGLLPHRLPSVPGVEVATRYRAAGGAVDVGGDFYDVFDTGQGSWGAVVGDVSGKGPEAAAVTGLARHTIRALAARERAPSRVLAALNDVLLNEETVDRFVTVCYMRIHPDDAGVRLTVACGGHPPPVVLRGNGELEAVGGHGTLIGIFPDPVLVDRTVDLAPGEAIVLYTDGVTEAFGRESIEAGPLGELLQDCTGLDAATIAGRLEQAVGAGSALQRDDICILVVRALPEKGPSRG